MVLMCLLEGRCLRESVVAFTDRALNKILPCRTTRQDGRQDDPVRPLQILRADLGKK